MRAIQLTAALWLGVAGACAAASLDFQRIKNETAGQLEELIALYKHLHQNPELSFQEAATSKLLGERLEKLGYRVTRNVGGHGVVAVLENGPGPTVLLRADMDALPVLENTGAEFASRKTAVDESGREVPVMHACGHDVHMTSLIGAARNLVKLKDAWSGTLVLICQPAEERGGGAKAMLEDGLFTRFPRPDYALALHVSESLEAGTIGFCPGYAMANVDSVDITIRGVSGHGAYPHLTKDPVVVAAHVIVALQTIVSREVSPTDAAVVTVGSIQGGTKHNVIPGEVALQLTVRSYSDETRAAVLESIDRIAKNTARALGIPEPLLPEIRFSDTYTPALYNSPELVETTVKALEGLVGAERIRQIEPVMGGEDFGRYGREEPRVPVFMFRLGAVARTKYLASLAPGGEPLPSLHSDRFLPDSAPTIQTGTSALTVAAMNLLRP